MVTQQESDSPTFLGSAHKTPTNGTTPNSAKFRLEPALFEP
jgi:hypothetical protein